MAKKQTRRSLSLNGHLYAYVQDVCRTADKPIAAYIESLIMTDLGIKRIEDLPTYRPPAPRPKRYPLAVPASAIDPPGPPKRRGRPPKVEGGKGPLEGPIEPPLRIEDLGLMCRKEKCSIIGIHRAH